ncbi:MAG: hypothetical protein ACLTXH_04510 [Enterobacter hormaechei]
MVHSSADSRQAVAMSYRMNGEPVGKELAERRHKSTFRDGTDRSKEVKVMGFASNASLFVAGLSPNATASGPA